MKKLKVFKWWWGWNFEEIENWLEEMALEGYRLTDVTSIGVIFSFEKTGPKKIRYCLDYQQKLEQKYISIINDDGWNFMPMGSGWYICRKEFKGDRPELYTDFDSLISRNNKLLFMIIISGLPFFIFVPFALIFIDIYIVRLSIAILWILICMFDIFVVTSIIKTNKLILNKKQLRNQ